MKFADLMIWMMFGSAFSFGLGPFVAMVSMAVGGSMILGGFAGVFIFGSLSMLGEMS